MVIFLTKRNDNGVAVIDGIDSTANVLSLIHPAFAGLTIITFVIKQIINYVCTDDIVKRINKIEKQLNNKKMESIKILSIGLFIVSNLAFLAGLSVLILKSAKRNF